LLKDELITKVRAAAKANLARAKTARTTGQLTYHGTTKPIIAIGASTGGVEALRDVFLALPDNLPPIVITQHMPEYFTRSFAARLDSLSRVLVSEAANHDRLKPGHAYIAPGNLHMRIVKVNGEYVCKIEDGPAVSSHRPSVDVLFHSVAESAKNRAVGVILTGMGRDGADGLLAMRNAGARTLGQDAHSCVVYGMPKVAMQCGAVESELALQDIPAQILRLCERIG
jgi:two-component system chemotaxis response regulator CheB